ncbi:MAG: hypothetical protein MRY63_09570 [Neomegalonema sp.]|nr:hypothetical protein [Neomegalonema sp.]
MKPLRFAFADLWADRVHFLCAAALIAAMTAPLLLLLAVKSGVVGTLLGELRQSPEIRLITVPGDHQFSPADIDEIRAWPQTGFVAPQSAAIITGRIALKAEGRRGAFVTGRVAPTGPGDPLTDARAPLPADAIILSAGFAQRLGVSVGDRVSLDLERFEPHPAVIAPAFRVAAILPARAAGGLFALMDPLSIDAMEAFGTGYAVPRWGVAAGRDPVERVLSYEKLRLYAADIDAVGALEARFEARFNLNAESQLSRIEAVRRLERNLDAAFAFVTGAGALGLFAALMALFWAGVERKKPDLSLLALMGARPVALAQVPMVQALIVALGGFALGLAGYALGAALVNDWFSGSLNGAVAILPASPALWMLAGVLATAMLAAGAAAYAAMRIDPALIIRES